MANAGSVFPWDRLTSVDDCEVVDADLPHACDEAVAAWTTTIGWPGRQEGMFRRHHLEYPDGQPELNFLRHTPTGKVVGAPGVGPRRVSWKGHEIRAGTLSHFCVVAAHRKCDRPCSSSNQSATRATAATTCSTRCTARRKARRMRLPSHRRRHLPVEESGGGPLLARFACDYNHFDSGIPVVQDHWLAGGSETIDRAAIRASCRDTLRLGHAAVDMRIAAPDPVAVPWIEEGSVERGREPIPVLWLNQDVSGTPRAACASPSWTTMAEPLLGMLGAAPTRSPRAG